MARAIDAECSEDYAGIAIANGICDVETIAKENEYITVSMLKEMLINFYADKGDVYYDGSWSYPELDPDRKSSYYEKYKTMHTFDQCSITENGHEVAAAKNGWGTTLVKLRDIMTAYNVNTEWDNGKVRLTDSDGQECVVYLDRTPGMIRIGNDNTLCMYISKEESDEYTMGAEYFGIIDFGQCEMINDSIYLYPKALFSLLGYMGITIETKPADISYNERDEQAAYDLWKQWIWVV